MSEEVTPKDATQPETTEEPHLQEDPATKQDNETLPQDDSIPTTVEDLAITRTEEDTVIQLESTEETKQEEVKEINQVPDDENKMVAEDNKSVDPERTKDEAMSEEEIIDNKINDEKDKTDEEGSNEETLDIPQIPNITIEDAPPLDTPAEMTSEQTELSRAEDSEVAITVEGELEGRIEPAPVLEDITEEDEEEEEEFDKEEAIEYYRTQLVNYEKLQTSHSQLQHKIAEYLARKKTEERLDPGRNVTDQEQRYQKCMEALEQLQHETAILKNEFEGTEHQLKYLVQQKQEQVDTAKGEFVAFIKEKSLSAVHSRTGRKLNNQEIDQYLNILERKDHDVTQVRLENIKLQNKINKQEMLIKQKEQLAEGLHMIDFEQLRINNVDLNEKIEERNEEILKLTKKVTSTVQVLAHLKEKLQFVQTENTNKKTMLREVDEQLVKKRDQLTRLKQAKDSIRTENVSLKQQGGLMAHRTLLRDFEDKLDQRELMLAELQDLQHRHSDLVLKCNALRRKIDQTRLLQTQ